MFNYISFYLSNFIAKVMFNIFLCIKNIFSLITVILCYDIYFNIV